MNGVSVATGRTSVTETGARSCSISSRSTSVSAFTACLLAL